MTRRIRQITVTPNSPRSFIRRGLPGLCAVVCAFLLPCLAQAAEGRLRMSVTTSTEQTGLLGALVPPFEKAQGLKVDVIAVGTGKALKLGENGDVDLVFVHDRAAEDKFVAEGFGVDRRDVMYNDYVIVGPPDDPAKIKGVADAVEALKKIAAAESLFVSRGDDSGTHRKERELWKAAGITPQGKWYSEAGQGMGPVLQMAFDKRGYALADRGTFYAMESKLDLVVLVEGGKALQNPYGIIAVNPAKSPHTNIEAATKFIDYVTGAEGQGIIGGFKANGKQLFFPDAKPR